MSFATISNTISLLRDIVRYNLKIVFANKFLYFVLAALLFLVLIVVINVVNDISMSEVAVYRSLTFPGVLLMFYPTVYGIQNDDDAKMLEIIFGIPNYRYKIWLTRFVLVLLVTMLNILFLSTLANFTLYRIQILEMAYELMFPMTFLASLGFMLSSRIRNGNGTAITMVVIGIAFTFVSGAFANSSWNLFLNPFKDPDNMSQTVWDAIVFKNRMYLSIGSLVCLLYALYNLQFRERFLRN